MREIFRLPTLMGAAIERPSDTLVIGFTFHPYPRLDGGIMAQLDAAHGFDFSTLDIIGKMAFPQPQDDVRAALAQIDAFIRPYRRIVTVGESVGGFLALNFAKRFRAAAAIAGSPPYSFMAEKMPSENRWGVYTDGVKEFPWDGLDEGVQGLGAAYVFYEPGGPDMAHIAAIVSAFPAARLLPVPFGGHPATRVLSQAGALGPLIADIVAGRFDEAGFRAIVRASRRASPAYLKHLAEAQPRRRDALKVRLLDMMHASAPSDAVQLLKIAPLVRLGREAEAQAVVGAVTASLGRAARQLNDLKKENDALRRRLAKLER